MKLNKDKKIFIVWGREMQLSENLGRALGAEVKQIYYKKIGPYNLPALIRYIFQAVETLLILFYEKPAAVIAQNPPIFAPLVALFYCKLSGAKLAIDSHTAAFLDNKWKMFYGLLKFVAKRAALNSCHNFKNLEILESWGVKPAMVMQFYNPVYNLADISLPLADYKIETALAGSALPIMMVNRFAADDDFQTVVKAAQLIPEANFFLTGNPAEVSGGLKELPANIVLTGYLTHREFLKLMRRSKVILAFTLRPDTVLWSVREIMALGKPFITTDSQVLRHYYGETGIFIKPGQAEELKQAILAALKDEEEIKKRIKLFLEKDGRRWDKEIEKYKSYLI